MAQVQIPGSDPARYLEINPAALFASGSGTSRTLAFYVEGSTTDYGIDDNATNYMGDHDAVASFMAFEYAPGIHDGLAKRTISSIEPISEASGEITFRIEIGYGELQQLNNEPVPKPNGTVEVTETTRLEAVHVRQALEVVRIIGVPAGVETHGAAIRVDRDGHVEGFDQLEPRTGFTLSWTLEAANISLPIRAGWKAAVGKTNSDTYQGYAPGELLFMGFTDSINYSNGAERIGFQFEYREDIPMESPEIIQGHSVYKKGWEVLDPVVVKGEDENGKDVSVLKGFKVLKVVKETSYADAKLPVPGQLTPGVDP